jgi:endonuclease VIII
MSAPGPIPHTWKYPESQAIQVKWLFYNELWRWAGASITSTWKERAGKKGVVRGVASADAAMPEGDTIHRIVRALEKELPGRTLDRLELRDRGEVRELAGRRIAGVAALGKHLLVHFEGGWSLRTHLGMNGRWVRRHIGEARPRGATATLVVGEAVYTCERAYTAEMIRTSTIRSHPKLARLGPDLLAEPAPVPEAVSRAWQAAYRDRQIGDVLLDQRVAAGIGNVYKSEVLFECRVHPRARVGEVGEALLARLFERASLQMRANLRTRRRTTVPLARRPRPASERLWVYGREGKPCLECGTTVQRFLQGDMGRSTYWCPSCQAQDKTLAGRGAKP